MWWVQCSLAVHSEATECRAGGRSLWSGSELRGHGFKLLSVDSTTAFGAVVSARHWATRKWVSGLRETNSMST